MDCLLPLGDIDTTHTDTLDTRARAHTHTHTHTHIYENLCDQRQRKRIVLLLGHGAWIG